MIMITKWEKGSQENIRVVQKYTKYMISKNNKLLHVKLSIKIHVMGFLTLSDPLG